MARRPRVEVAGVPLHVIQRGNNRAACFHSDGDRYLYLRLLAGALTKYPCALHAYVLMPNHVHLLVTPQHERAVAAMMQDLGRRYVRIFNDVHGRTGTLWEGRYKASLIDSERYLLTCQRYIELNPVRAGLVQRPADYRWSSHRHYAFGAANPLITSHPLIHSLALDEVNRRRAYLALFQEQLEPDTLNLIRTTANKGWALGSEAFLKELEAATGRAVRPPKRGRPRRETGPAHDPGEMLI
jgi:putative transposase